MVEEDDFEIDPAMAEAMGFSSFGMQPGKKRKFNTDDAFVAPRATTTQARKQHNVDSAMEPEDLTMRNSTSSHAPPPGVAQEAVYDQSKQQKPRQEGGASITAPREGTATASNVRGSDERSLQALAYGVRNENGDMIYFLPSFLEDPWKNLRPR